MEFDCFISHASEDKKDFVIPLLDALEKKGFKVWYDENSMLLGDSLRKSIDFGLAKSSFGVVVLSPSFFKKGWTEYEFNALVQWEVSEKKRKIIPVWHNVNHHDILKYSAALADKVGVPSSPFDEAVKRISEAINPRPRLHSEYGPTCEWCGGPTDPLEGFDEYEDQIDEDLDEIEAYKAFLSICGSWICPDCGWDNGEH